MSFKAMLAAFAVACLSVSGCGQSGQTQSAAPAEAPAAPPADVVGLIKTIGMFSMVSRILETSEMAATMAEPAYTVFAPTDEAINKLSEADIEKLVTDKVAATAFLKHHMVSGKVEYANLPAGKSTLTALDGSTIHMEISDAVYADGGKVIQMNIPATNGVLHVLDTVLPSTYTPK